MLPSLANKVPAGTVTSPVVMLSPNARLSVALIDYGANS
jgi:hypothetical protein